MSSSKQRWSLLAHRASRYQISRTRLQQIPIKRDGTFWSAHSLATISAAIPFMIVEEMI
jgi:hypothetical protein